MLQGTIRVDKDAKWSPKSPKAPKMLTMSSCKDNCKCYEPPCKSKCVACRQHCRV